MAKPQRIALIFPGQGAQYVGMGKDFCEGFPVARETFEEADHLLRRALSRIVHEGPEETLTETQNSQVGIYVDSMAIFRVLQEQFPQLHPTFCAGLSLGEYSALTASKRLDFEPCLHLVDHRGRFMSEACEATKGTMAVVMGLEAAQVEELVRELNLPHDLWVANLNCPGQVVISGTVKGIEKGTEKAKACGARRVLPLKVHGAFHSGLMQEAEDRLREFVEKAPLQESEIELVMNVPGDFVKDLGSIRKHLTKQVTQSVRWEQGVRAMMREAVDLFVEVGCGKTLAGMNKRIGVTAPTVNVDRVGDLEALARALEGE